MQQSQGRLLGKVAFFLLAIIFLSVAGAWARPTTAEEAKNMVINWLGFEAQPMDAAMSQQVKEVRSYPGPDGTTAYYVVFLQPRGLVIVPADDLVEPIIGFLPDKMTYSPSKRNPLGALVSSDVTGRVVHARGVEAASLESGQPLAAGDPLTQAQRKWAWLANPVFSTEALESALPGISRVRVAPFVKSRWNQTTVGGAACYNYYTPPYAAGDADNYPSGCVATAMAQLMRYFRWPLSGVGTGSYTIYIDGYADSTSLRGGNGAGGAYPWSSMPLVPSAPSTAERQAIGALLHDAGAAVNMDYAAAGSGTDTLYAAAAFTGPFKYSNAKTAINSTATNLAAANRDRMVNPNLHAKYPILFGITGPAGGHAIVCDGYGYQTGAAYHHLNMGWAGYADAWYNLPTIDAGGYDFTSVYKCVYNVYKAGTGEIIAGQVTDSSGKGISGATVKATRTSGAPFVRTGTTDNKGIYALVKVPSATTFKVSVTKTGYTFTKKNTTTGTSVSGTWYSRNDTCGNVLNLNFKAKAP
ncbi:MAG: peptidase C10 [Deltaproteobacteria bacterium]|nr:MAG: peptidase C10 [Deltaproteobacteria bacterium]